MNKLITQDTRQARFFLSTLSGRTELNSGDYFTLLAGHGGYNLSNLLLLRADGAAIGIKSEQNGSYPLDDLRKIFSPEEARLIAVAMAVASGFALEETATPSLHSDAEHLIFRFL